MASKSRRTLPCFLALHRKEHCFGYFGTEKNNKEPSFAKKTLYECRSCTNPETKMIVEVAEDRSDDPKSHLYVSDRLAFCNGMSGGEELILEEVISTTLCTRISIEPATINDYEILQCSRFRVETVFLDQLRFVAQGMHFPIWVEPNVCIIFRVLSIEPNSGGQMVRLAENTEVEIEWPTSNVKSDSPLVSSPQKPTHKAVASEILASLTSGAAMSGLLSHCDFPEDEKRATPMKFRVLFQSFFEERDEFGALNIVLSLSSEENGSVPRFQIVEVERPNLKTSAVWIKIPHGVCSESYRCLAEILRDHENHCIISDNLRQSGIHDGFNIRLRPFLQKQCIILSELVAETTEEVDSTALSNAVQQHFYSHNSYVTGFGVMDEGGLKVELNVKGQMIEATLKPTSECASQGMTSTRRCFLFSTSKLPNLSFEVLPKVEKPKEVPEKLIADHETQSYGSRKLKTNTVPLMCQSFVVSQLTSKILFSLSERNENQQNAVHHLLTGARLSGKSSILRLLAVELELHSLTVFSKYIDCFSWKGKSAETIERRLNAVISVLSARQPAILLLDNIDFFTLKNEGEERVISTEKSFFAILDMSTKF
ncbi:hypothetical protein L596_014997 [Steinernema carpocapsae]|uniref:Uncharacterized protein n=1 Tax=Steinernema carpocapsae TaxID=34508 RepID=A0A4U5NDM7_STECR|nr:hypothetical protein L596_014997 [Steinernema carpocapsae]